MQRKQQGDHLRQSRSEFLRRAGAAAASIGLGARLTPDALAALGRAGRGGRAGGTHSFVSRPDLRPPVLSVLQRGPVTAPGFVFLAPNAGPGARGPLIVDDYGGVLWFQPTTPQTAMNFRAGVYRGEPVLTWWQGKAHRGLGRGDYVIVDASYRELARFGADLHLDGDLHEFLLTPEGTALITSNEIRTADLRSVGGSAHGRVVGGVVQELDVASGRLLFEWRSLDHVPVTESHAKVGPRYDYFHVNSIDLGADGNLLVSARNTWATYKVSRRTGQVLWRLGGKRSDFRMGRGTFFAWQHDARWHYRGRLLSIFDDGAAPPVEPRSRALVLAVDEANRRVSLVHSYVHRPQKLLAKFMGNTQMLPDGDVFVGWGSEPYMTEFAADGTIRFDARLPHGGENYRAFRFPWIGRPRTRPALAARGGRLYASWNGATEVAAWRVETGANADLLRPGAAHKRYGFETALPAPTGGYAAVAALDRHGNTLARSQAVLVR